MLYFVLLWTVVVVVVMMVMVVVVMVMMMTLLLLLLLLLSMVPYSTSTVRVVFCVYMCPAGRFTNIPAIVVAVLVAVVDTVRLRNQPNQEEEEEQETDSLPRSSRFVSFCSFGCSSSLWFTTAAKYPDRIVDVSGSPSVCPSEGTLVLVDTDNTQTVSRRTENSTEKTAHALFATETARRKSNPRPRRFAIPRALVGLCFACIRAMLG